MQFEMTNSTCALCKSAFAPSADAYPGPSRLCLACQRLVQTILPRSGVYAVRGAAPSMGELFASDAVEAAATNDGFEYAEEVREIESDFYRPEEESYFKTEFEIQPHQDEAADFVEDFPGAPHQGLDQGQDEEGVSTPARSEASSYDAQPAADAWQGATLIYGAQPAPDYSPPATAPLNGHEVEAQPVGASAGEANTSATLAQSYDEQATDPWENPLPAWEYSKSEYPVLLGLRKKTNQKRFFWIIVAGLLIVFFVIGYFVMARPDAADSNNGPRASEPSDTPGAAEANPAASAAGQQGAPGETVTDAAPAQSIKSAASTEFGSVGSLTLQTAAFPDEAGANEFTKKLISAGIPAYVVPADLQGKGRWFRVRVGRFSNADDAKKYAVQSRLRAKAAGMNVDFIVVEYGKP
ncbi:MAG TPA: SPOR domain-containing protein [Blastocatellia bacterium]|nr:SPOR domain-containing protein [Blastocatellia bacterium]